MEDERLEKGEKGDEARARSFIVNSLAARAQSIAEIEAKLVARSVPPDLIDEVVDGARRLGYLDDSELAGQLARGCRSRRFGRRRAADTLRRRGIGTPEAEVALDDAYGSGDEPALAAAALGARPVTKHTERRRAVAFLVRRGFSATVVWEVVRART